MKPPTTEPSMTVNKTIEYGQRVDGDKRKRVNFTLRASVHDAEGARRVGSAGPV